MGRDDRPEPGNLSPIGSSVLGRLGQALLEQHAALPASHRALPLGLCLSSGADSCALVLAASQVRERIPVEVTVLHACHGLRGDDSVRDRQACRDLAARCGFAFREVEAVVAPGPNLEERARSARYEALQRAFPGLLATAHHRGDQVETLVLRLLRGAGPIGLRGIHRLRDDRVWRPLLDVPGSLLKAACEEAGWEWRLDASNTDQRHLRNWVRHAWLPSQDAHVEAALWNLALSCEALAPALGARLDFLAASCRLVADASGFRLDLGRWEIDELCDAELDLLVHRAWAASGRRPWATDQRERLIADVLSGRAGRRRGGQEEIAVWGNRILQVRPERFD